MSVEDAAKGTDVYLSFSPQKLNFSCTVHGHAYHLTGSEVSNV